MAEQSFNDSSYPFPAQLANITLTSPGRKILTQADIDDLGKTVSDQETILFVSLGEVELATLRTLLNSLAGKARAFRTRFSPGEIKEKIRVVETESIHTRVPSVGCQAGYNSMGKVIYDMFRLDNSGQIFCRQSLDTSTRVIVCSLLSQSSRISDTLNVTMGTLENLPDPNNRREFSNYLRTLTWQLEFKYDTFKKLECHRWKSLFIKKNCATWVPSHLEATVDYLETSQFDALVPIENRIRAAQQMVNSKQDQGTFVNWGSHNQTDLDEQTPWIPVKPHHSRDSRFNKPFPDRKDKKFVQKDPGRVGDRYNPQPPDSSGFLQNRFDKLGLDTQGTVRFSIPPPNYTSTPAHPPPFNPEKDKNQVSDQSNLVVPPGEMRRGGRENKSEFVRGVVTKQSYYEPKNRFDTPFRKDLNSTPRSRLAEGGSFPYRQREPNDFRGRRSDMNRRRLHSPDDQRHGPPHKQQSPGPEADKSLFPGTSKPPGKQHGPPPFSSVFPTAMLKDVDEYKDHINDIEHIESDEEAFHTADIIASTPENSEDKDNAAPGRNTPVLDENPYDSSLEAEVWTNTPKAEEAQQRISQLDQAPASSTLPISLSSVEPAMVEMMILNTGKPFMDDSSVNVPSFLADGPVNRERPSERENSKKREKMKLLMELTQNHVAGLDLEIARLKSQREAFLQNNPAEVAAEFSQHIKRKARIHEQLTRRAIDKDINNAYRDIRAKKKLKRKMRGKQATMDAIMDVFEFVEEMPEDEFQEGTEHDYEEIQNPKDEVLLETKATDPPDPVVDANKKAEDEMRTLENVEPTSSGGPDATRESGAAGGNREETREPADQ